MRNQNAKDLLFGAAFLAVGSSLMILVPLIFVPGLVLIVVGARRLLRGWHAIRKE